MSENVARFPLDRQARFENQRVYRAAMKQWALGHLRWRTRRDVTDTEIRSWLTQTEATSSLVERETLFLEACSSVADDADTLTRQDYPPSFTSSFDFSTLQALRTALHLLLHDARPRRQVRQATWPIANRIARLLLRRPIKDRAPSAHVAGQGWANEKPNDRDVAAVHALLFGSFTRWHRGLTLGDAIDALMDSCHAASTRKRRTVGGNAE